MNKLSLLFLLIVQLGLQSVAYSQTASESKEIRFEGSFIDEAQGLNCFTELRLEPMTNVKFKIISFKITDRSQNPSIKCTEKEITSEEKVNFFEKSPLSSNGRVIYYNAGETTIFKNESGEHSSDSIDKNTQLFIYKVQGSNQYYLSMNLNIENLDYETQMKYPVAINLQRL